MVDNPLSILESHYLPRLEKYQKSEDILDWEDKKAHLKRFEVLINCLDLRNLTLLDVGCGLADLYHYLFDKQITVNYIGVDILEAMITKAKAITPNVTLRYADIIYKSYPEDLPKPDVIFASGIFNLNTGNNKQLLKDAIHTFYQLSKSTFCFNLLDTSVEAEYGDKYFYLSPQEILVYLHGYSVSTTIVRNYLHGDYTVICKH